MPDGCVLGATALDNDAVADGYQLVRTTLDKLVVGDVISWSKRNPYFHMVKWVYPHTTWKGEPKVLVDYQVVRHLNTFISDRVIRKPDTVIWKLDKLPDAG